jgi:hypothetical protein
MAGATYEAIGRALGVSKTRAYRIVMGALGALAAKTGEDADRVRTLELSRIDAMVLSLWPNRANPRVADTLIRLSERRARLLGLDAPARVEQTGADGGPIKTEAVPSIDTSRLSDEELNDLERILSKATAAPARD